MRDNQCSYLCARLPHRIFKKETGTEKKSLSSTFRTATCSETQAVIRVPLQLPAKERFTSATKPDQPAVQIKASFMVLSLEDLVCLISPAEVLIRIYSRYGINEYELTHLSTRKKYHPSFLYPIQVGYAFFYFFFRFQHTTDGPENVNVTFITFVPGGCPAGKSVQIIRQIWASNSNTKNKDKKRSGRFYKRHWGRKEKEKKGSGCNEIPMIP